MAQWTLADSPDLTGKVAVVTGGNSGLGRQTARGLGLRGASVVLACRNSEKAEAAINRLLGDVPSGDFSYIRLDLADLDSVEEFVSEFGERHQHLDILCNNAGVMALPLRRTQQGFEMQFGTNHLGHFALTGRLLPLLVGQPGGRVVNVSSIMHRFGRMRWHDLNWERTYSKWMAYSQSKLANLLFTFELQRRCNAAHNGVTAAAAHPGYSATNLQEQGARMVGSSIKRRFFRLGNSLLAQSARDGALPILRACTEDELRGADYFGPSGLAERAGAPVRVGSTKAARNAKDAKALWEASVELTGVDFGGL